MTESQPDSAPDDPQGPEGAGQDEAQPERPIHPTAGLARRPEDSLSAEAIRRMTGEHDLETLRRLAEPLDELSLGRWILEQEEWMNEQMRRYLARGRNRGEWLF